MDLRSAHKATEKPPARLRLSLTRSLDPEFEEDLSYGACRRILPPRLVHRKNKPRTSQFGCLTSNPPTPTRGYWESREEEDEEEEEGDEVEEEDMEEEETQRDSERGIEMCGAILNGKRVTRSASKLLITEAT